MKMRWECCSNSKRDSFVFVSIYDSCRLTSKLKEFKCWLPNILLDRLTPQIDDRIDKVKLTLSHQIQ